MNILANKINNEDKMTNKLNDVQNKQDEYKDELKYFTTLYKIPKYLEKVIYFLSYFFSVFSIQI